MSVSVCVVFDLFSTVTRLLPAEHYGPRTTHTHTDKRREEKSKKKGSCKQTRQADKRDEDKRHCSSSSINPTTYTL